MSGSGRHVRGVRQRHGHLLQRCCIEALEERLLLSVNVLTWHNDLTRQGLNDHELALTPANVNSTSFGRLFSYPVQGQVYAQPLYVSNLTIPGQGVHNVVFVATQHNDVYALDADNPDGINGGVLWHVNLGPSAATPNPFFANRYGPYHDINPQVGITSTPVIDLNSGTLYVDAFTNDVPGQNAFSHHIWALDIATGAPRVAPMLVAATLPGNSAGSANGVLTFTASQQLQRAALTLFNGIVYVAYTGYADTNPYHGWILGFDPGTLQLVTAFNTTPTADSDPGSEAGEGGIWQTGNGLSSDGSKLYVMVANGDFNAGAASSDWGDSFLQLTPGNPANSTKNGYGLSVTDYFTPFNEQSLADADQDLGSGGAMILTDQAGAHPHELLGAGKSGVIYLVDRDNMGQHTTTVDNVVQKVSLGHGVFSSPAYFNNTVYYHAVGDVLKAFSINNGVLSAAPVASGSTTYSQWGATPSVSANGNANGIVWDLQFSATAEVLHAYNAATLSELYNSNQNAPRDRLGPGVKFTTPTVADGKVFVGTDGFLTIYGLLVSPTAPPSAPADLTATTPVANQIQLNWTDTAGNENNFKIERSTDGMNFTQIATASANAQSYADATVLPGTNYTYRVRASNTAGDSDYSNTAGAAAVAVSVPLELYAFEEGTGTLTADSIGGNNGTLVGSKPPLWVPGRVGGMALSFQGSGNSQALVSAVQAGTNLGVILGSTASLSAWIRTTQTGSNTPTAAPAITGVERSGSTADVRWGYLDASGHIGVSAGNNAGAVSTSAINDGNWHHVAFTRNASTGIVQVYVDGRLQAQATGDTGKKDAVFRLIGAQSNVQSGDGSTLTSATFLNAQLDDIRIFDQVLSAAEVATLGRIPAAPTGLTAKALSGSLVQLNWANVSSFAQNIEIDRRAGTSGDFAQIALLVGSAAQYNDTGLTAGTQYFYRIRALDAAGASAFTAPVNVVPPQPVIIGRYTFYNNSIYDGQNGSSNVADDRALAPGKEALLPGQAAGFQNYTSYSRGLNGILIDFTNLENVPGLDDFTFRVGNGGDPSTWQDAPAPSYVTTYPGRGVGGSVRLELLWPDDAIKNQWLQVTVKNTGAINMAAPDVFYFGNAVGESGDATLNAKVSAVDEIAARFNAGTGVGLASPYDFNRDGNVDAGDQAIARANQTNVFTALQLFTPPAMATAAAGQAGPSAGGLVKPSLSLGPPPLFMPAALVGRIDTRSAEQQERKPAKNHGIPLRRVLLHVRPLGQSPSMLLPLWSRWK